MGASVRTQGGGGRRTGRRTGRSRRSAAAQPMSEINVTPFVDVMLVLLIVFMVAAPLLTVGVPVELPRSAATPLPTAQEEPLTVTLAEDGRLLIQTAPTQPSQLVPKLRAIAAERQDDQLYLRADGAIPYERVMQVMGALNAGGFTRIGLVTEAGASEFDAAAGPETGPAGRAGD